MRPEQLAQARLISERLGGVALALRAVGSYFGSSIADHDLGELAAALDANRPTAGRHRRTGWPRSGGWR